VRGTFGISSELLDRLAELLGLRVAVVERRPESKKSRKKEVARGKSAPS
jgi:hypothetical protein